MSELVRVCRLCTLEVSERWHHEGKPVFWTCPECGIRDDRETEKVPAGEVEPDAEAVSEEAQKL